MVLNLLIVVFVVVSGVGLIWIGVSFLRAKRRFSVERVEALQGFFQCAEPLLSDSETPEELIDIISTLDEALDDIGALKALAAVIARKKPRHSLSNQAAEWNATTTQFFARRPELERPWGEMIYHWFVAVTAQSVIYGSLARSLFATEKSPAKTAAKSVAKANNDHTDKFPPAGLVKA